VLFIDIFVKLALFSEFKLHRPLSLTLSQTSFPLRGLSPKEKENGIKSFGERGHSSSFYEYHHSFTRQVPLLEEGSEASE
jgi:hypothetical protein